MVSFFNSDNVVGLLLNFLCQSDLRNATNVLELSVCSFSGFKLFMIGGVSAAAAGGGV